MLDVPSIIVNLSQIIGALVVIWGAIKWIGRPLGRHIKKIAKIVEELQPNSGKSLFDKVSATKDSVDRIDSRLDKIERRQRAAFSFDSKAWFETNSMGDCVWSSRGYLKLLEATHEDVLGEGWRNYIDFEDRDRVYKTWDDCVKQGRDFREIFRYRTSDGKKKCVFCEAFVQKNPEGKVTGFLGCVVEHADSFCD